MSTQLMSRFERFKRIKLKEEAVKLDVKDPIQAAVVAKTIKDIRSGDFDNIGNLQEVAGGFATQGANANAPIVIGRETITVLTKGKDTAESQDASTTEVMLADGWSITGTKVVDIVG